MPDFHENSSDHADFARALSLAAHEFRTPASVVGGYLHMLLTDPQAQLSDRQRKMIEEARKSCARIVELVGQLSELGKVTRGPVVATAARFPLFSLLRDLAKSVHEAEDRGVHLDVRGASADPIVNGDQNRLRAAFDAIFRAVLREQGTACTVVADCRIDAKAGPSCAVVIVAPEQHVQRVYSSPPAPFDDMRGGLGLGLPIARRVIEGHGGQIWSPADAASAEAGPPPGRGSILVTLPVEAES